ncbi:MAG: hypothetical protein AB1700_16120 [Bacillota bacterium]
MTHKLTERQVTRLRRDFEKKRTRTQVKEWLKTRRQEKEARRGKSSRLDRAVMELVDDAFDEEGYSND